MYIYIEFSNDYNYNPLIKILLLIIICILTYLSSQILIKHNKKYKCFINKINLIIWFVLYIIFLLKITLLDSYLFRRGVLIVDWNKIIIRDYLNFVINLIPFRVITEFFTDLINMEISFDKFVYNIFGNIIAFMPFAFFLPILFKKENNVKIFIITMIIIVSLIEMTQFITLSGTFDIDDYILNVGGAYLMFCFLKKEKIREIIERIF